jgi:hypothetical protein
VGLGGARDLYNLLKGLTNPPSDNFPIVERSLLAALVASLQHDDQKIAYFESIIKIFKENNGDVASLNYDLIAEECAKNGDYVYDYGLDKWNKEKILSFRRSGPKIIKLLKLHGSLNWFADGDDININDDEKKIGLPNLVFGGLSDKLRIDGPFLQLRHEFQSRLLNSNLFVVIGYSFQDEHLNSIIRRWTNTRRKAKLIVINPADTGSFSSRIGHPYVQSDDRKLKLTVDLNHIKMGASDGIESLRNLIGILIDLRRDDRNGAIPHKHFKVFEA